MTRRPRRLLRRLALIAIVLVCIYAAYVYFTAPATIGDAIGAGKVSAQAVFGGTDSGATITVTPAAGAAGGLRVVVPAGTVLYTGDAAAQRLMTAEAMFIAVPPAANAMSAQVKTFCMDEFAATPAVNASLRLEPRAGDRSVSEEETEPLHKLANCMSGVDRPDADKQLAVWAVKDDLLHMPASDALDFLTKGFEGRITSEQRETIVTRERPALVRDHPLLSESDIDTLITNEMHDEAAEIHDKAASQAHDQLENFRRRDRDLLQHCGYETADLPIFR